MATSNATKYCPAMCDNWICWPSTKPDHNVTMPCPKLAGTLENAVAYRHCTSEGRWETKNTTNGTRVDYTHYEACIMLELQELAEMCNQFGNDTCLKIANTTRIIEMVGLSFSFMSLLISLYVFFSYRILKNNRTRIHKNLFVATLLQVDFRLIKYIDQHLTEENKFLLKDYYLYEICTTLMEYAKTAMFMWMFIEGLYLHNVITVAVFREHLYINIYVYAGWIIPAIMTAIWLGVMIWKVVETTWTYYYFLPYYWILEGPRFFLIIVNLLFLLNIIRVLIAKLRETRSSELEQVRKAVRAAIFLLPLMGIAHILFLLDYRVKRSWVFALWSYTTYFLNTFQGFFVAVLYCFLNGEVQLAIKNSFYLQMSLRNYDYAPCRNVTSISSGSKDANDGGQSRKSSGCTQCWKKTPHSPEDNAVDICDNGRRHTTVLPMVETTPMINNHYDRCHMADAQASWEQTDLSPTGTNEPK
ncbi:PDF receptor-like [Cylas formicarius]|uniref:PDF receptor-like n=1 Tax=Cylas formicarius TaxID=197179 RepID=UPI0029588E69|nr:PDF receptor-like [Cylas formicarius]